MGRGEGREKVKEDGEEEREGREEVEQDEKKERGEKEGEGERRWIKCVFLKFF